MKIPDASNYASFKKFVDQMVESANPEMLGLPANAELMLRVQQEKHIGHMLLTLQESQADVEATASVNATLERRRSSSAAVSTNKPRNSISFAGDVVGQRPPWMIQMSNQVGDWLKRLPESLVTMQRSAQTVKDPLFRSLEREVTRFSDLLYQ